MTRQGLSSARCSQAERFERKRLVLSSVDETKLSREESTDRVSSRARPFGLTHVADVMPYFNTRGCDDAHLCRTAACIRCPRALPREPPEGFHVAAEWMDPGSGT